MSSPSYHSLPEPSAETVPDQRSQQLLSEQHECSQTAGNGIPLRGASEFSGVRQIVPCVTAQLAMQGPGKPYAHPGHQNVAHRCLELQTRTNVEPWLSVAGPENRLSMGSDPVRLSKVGNHAKSNRRKKRRRPVVRDQREELMIRTSLTSLEGLHGKIRAALVTEMKADI